MKELIINHPIITYLLVSAIFGIYLVNRFTPEQLRLRAENLNRAAYELEEIKKQSHFPEIHMGIMFLFGILWAALVPLSLFRMFYRILWGVERME